MKQEIPQFVIQAHGIVGASHAGAVVLNHVPTWPWMNFPLKNCLKADFSPTKLKTIFKWPDSGSEQNF